MHLFARTFEDDNSIVDANQSHNPQMKQKVTSAKVTILIKVFIAVAVRQRWFAKLIESFFWGRAWNCILPSIKSYIK
jgi:hypothetical protein